MNKRDKFLTHRHFKYNDDNPGKEKPEDVKGFTTINIVDGIEQSDKVALSANVELAHLIRNTAKEFDIPMSALVREMVDPQLPEIRTFAAQVRRHLAEEQAKYLPQKEKMALLESTVDDLRSQLNALLQRLGEQ